MQAFFVAQKQKHAQIALGMASLSVLQNTMFGIIYSFCQQKGIFPSYTANKLYRNERLCLFCGAPRTCKAKPGSRSATANGIRRRCALPQKLILVAQALYRKRCGNRLSKIQKVRRRFLIGSGCFRYKAEAWRKRWGDRYRSRGYSDGKNCQPALPIWRICRL